MSNWKQASLEEGALRIRTGEIVVFPTETFYGLAVDPALPAAVEKLLALKERGISAGVPLIISKSDIADSWAADADEKARQKRLELQERFWPGPLTVVLALKPEAKEMLHAGIFGPGETVAVRVSSGATAQALAEAAGGAITATSANPHGQPPAGKAEQARQYFPTLFVLEDDATQSALPSTIIDSRGFPFRILREGAIPASELGDFL